MVHQLGKCLLQLEIKAEPGLVLVGEDVEVAPFEQGQPAPVEERGRRHGDGLEAQGERRPAVGGPLGEEKGLVGGIPPQPLQPIHHAVASRCKLEAGHPLAVPGRTQVSALHGDKPAVDVEIGDEKAGRVKRPLARPPHAQPLLRAHDAAHVDGRPA